MADDLVERPADFPSSPFPLGDDRPTPEQAFADLEASLDEPDEDDLVVAEEELPPVGRSWQFDFGQQRFVSLESRGLVESHGIGTLSNWIEKCLRTDRGAHPIHPPGYGLVKPTDLIGQPIDNAPLADLFDRIKDALTFHDRITDVRGFDADYDPNDEWVTCTFTVIVDEETPLQVEVTLP